MRTVLHFSFSLFITLGALTLGAISQAATCDGDCYGDSASGELTGSRSVGGGLSGSGGWSSDFSVSWVISNNFDGTYDYEYTFDWDGPGISHVVFDLSDDCVSGDSLADPDCVTSAMSNGSSATLDFGDKDGITGAVKFDDEKEESR